MSDRRMLLSIDRYSAKGFNKGGKSLKTVYEHNSRRSKEYPANADPELKHLNQHLVEDRPQGTDINEFIQREYDDLYNIGAAKHHMSKNAVATICVLMEACGVVLENGVPPADFDMEGWRDASMAWVEKEFNVSNREIHYTDRDGVERTRYQNNIYLAELHLDERTPHIHVMIEPVDEHGQFTGGYRFKGIENAYSKYQDSYFEAVKQFGLSRGAKGTRTRKPDQNFYYANIDTAVAQEAPTILPGETTEEYKVRADDVVKQCYCHMNDQDINHQREARDLKASIRLLNKTFGLGDSEEAQIDRAVEEAAKLDEHRRLEIALREYPDREAAEDTLSNIREILDWYEKGHEHQSRNSMLKEYFKER